MRIISHERKIQLINFQKKIGYHFENIHLLNRALTHSSYANEHKKSNLIYNERLEFLGDSVLGVIVSEYIFSKYPEYPEGELTKLRATVVCEPSLAYIAKNIGLGSYILLGKGEEATGGRDRVSILADAFEAVIGSIYLDGKLRNAKKFTLKYLSSIIEEAVNGGDLFIDYKTQLQETIQKVNKNKIDYVLVNEEGPDHNKTFFMEVRIGEDSLGTGSGRSKKEAEQNAAKLALVNLGGKNED